MRIGGWMIVLCVGVSGCATEPPKVPTSLAPRWIATLERCQVWDPYPVAGEIVSWSGSCTGGFTEGQGRLIWKLPRPEAREDQASILNTEDFKTRAINDQRMIHGLGQGHEYEQAFDINTGKLRYTVDGQIKDSRLEGQGTFVTPQGVRYVGGFHLGKFDGHGISQFPNGNRYEGEFRNGFWEGHGLLTWGQGNSYEGDFHLGQADGSGTLTLAGSGSQNKPQLILNGMWQRGCFIDPARYGCLHLTRDQGDGYHPHPA